MKIKAIRTQIFREGDDLMHFIMRRVKRLPEKSVLAITSKIVALAERRTSSLTSERAKERLIKQESQWAAKTRWTWLTIKDNAVMSSAGIDESNADGKLVLLPKDSFAAARDLRRKLKNHYRVKRLGVLITDSRLMPLRAGIVGIALGYAGIRGIRDYRGTPDLFGRTLKMSRVDIADGLATAAVIEMGEGAEQRPLAIITDAYIDFTDRIDRQELLMDFRDDVYLPLFENVKQVKLKRIKGPW